MPAKRRGRKIIVGLTALVLVVVILIALAPTLAGLGPGRALVAGAITDRINGEARIDRLSLSWMGDQSVRGLVITDAAGAEAANLHVTLKAGLLSLLTGLDRLDLTLAGTLNGELRRDGSTSFAELIRTSEGGTGDAKSDKPGDGGDRSPLLGGVPPTSLVIDGLKVKLDEGGGNRTLVLESLTGNMEYRPGAPSELRLESKTRCDDLAGSVDIKVQAEGLFDSRGALTPAKATVKADGEFHNLPVFFDETVDQISAFVLTARTDDLSERLDVNVSLDAIAGSESAGALRGDIVLEQPLNADGKPNVGPESITGSIVGSDVPTSLLQPFVADTGIDLHRDLGPKLNAELTFGEGSTKRVEMHVSAAHASVDVIGDVNSTDGSVVGEKLHVQSRIDPGLVSAFTEVGLENATEIVIDLTSFHLPGRDEDDARSWDDLAATGTVSFQEPVGIALNEESGKTGTVQSIESSFDLSGAEGRFLLAGSLTLAAILEPSALAGWTDLQPDRPVEAALEFGSFRVPFELAERKVPLPAVGVEGGIRLSGPLAIALPGEKARTVSIKDLSLDFESKQMRDGVSLNGSAAVDDGSISIEEHLTGFFDAEGSPAPLGARPVGSVKLRGIDGALIASFLPEGAKMALPLLEGPVDLTVKTSLDGEALLVDARADGRAFKTEISAGLDGDNVHVASGQAELTVTPALAAALQPDAEEPVVPVSKTTIVARVEPFDMPGFKLPDTPLAAHVTVGEAAFAQIPGLGPLADGEVLSIRELATDLTARLGEAQSFAMTGEAVLHRPAAERNLGRVNWDLQAQTVPAAEGEVPVFQPRGSVTLKNVSPQHVELMLGKNQGAFSDWLGGRGDITARLDSKGDHKTLTIEPAMPNLTGRFIAQADEKMVSIRAETSMLTLRQTALQRLLAPQGEDEGDTETTLTVTADLPLEVQVKECRLPKTMLTGGPVEADKVRMDLLLTGGPLKVANTTGEGAELENIRAAVTADGLAEGVNFSLTGEAAGGAESGRKGDKGMLKIEGTLSGLLAEDATFDTGAASVRMTANARQIPTAVPDVLGGMGGLLVAAVGPLMNGEAIADNFSATGGTLDFSVQTANGMMEGVLRGKEGTLRTSKSKPVQAELALTEPLRERLLYKIHPLLADIRTTEQPLRFAAPYGVIPVDGDVSKLKADLDVTIGAVELDSGSTLLGLLLLANQAHKSTIRGYVEPIHVRIRNGIIRYDAFSVRLDKHTLVYSGTIDLNKQTVDLRTEIPLEGLAVSIEELQGYADKIVVPMVTRGKFGDLKTQIDPDFDLGEAAIRSGFRGILGDVFKDKGLPLGEIFNRLLEEGGRKRGGG